MPVVNVVIDRNNVITVPNKTPVTPPDLSVTWNVTNNGTLQLLDPPIQFPWPVPSGAPAPTACASWSQYTGSVSSGPGTNQWTAVFPTLPSGQRQCYKYNIAYTTGALDPEVENQGPPPGPFPIEVPPKERPDATPGVRPDDKKE